MYTESEWIRYAWISKVKFNNRKEIRQTCDRHMSRLMTNPTKWHVRPATTQISRGIRPVWSESSLCTQWIAKDPSFLHTDSEDSDQTGRMPRLICLRWAHISFCWFCHKAAHVLCVIQLVSSMIFCILHNTSDNCSIYANNVSYISWHRYL